MLGEKVFIAMPMNGKAMSRRMKIMRYGSGIVRAILSGFVDVTNRMCFIQGISRFSWST